jgi:hypothetical protein
VEDLLGPEAGAAVAPPEDAALNGFRAIGNAQLALIIGDIPPLPSRGLGWR